PFVANEDIAATPQHAQGNAFEKTLLDDPDQLLPCARLHKHVCWAAHPEIDVRRQRLVALDNLVKALQFVLLGSFRHQPFSAGRGQARPCRTDFPIRPLRTADWKSVLRARGRSTRDILEDLSGSVQLLTP